MRTPKTSRNGIRRQHGPSQQAFTRRLTKDDDPVHDPLRSSGDLLGRVRCLSSSEDHGLGTGVRIGSTDKGAEKGEEPGFGTASDAGELVHRSRVAPVSEPNPVPAWSATEVDDQTENDQSVVIGRHQLSARSVRSIVVYDNVPNESDDLQASGDDFRLSVKLDAKHIEDQEGQAEDGDPDGGVQVGPVGDDDRACAEFRGDREGVSNGVCT